MYFEVFSPLFGSSSSHSTVYFERFPGFPIAMIVPTLCSEGIVGVVTHILSPTLNVFIFSYATSFEVLLIR
jgi:hypothetical protein